MEVVSEFKQNVNLKKISETGSLHYNETTPSTMIMILYSEQNNKPHLRVVS